MEVLSPKPVPRPQPLSRRCQPPDWFISPARLPGVSSRPDPMDLWKEAGGGTPEFSAELWHALISERILGEGSEFPSPADMNWELLKVLAARPHPLVNNDWKPPEIEDPGWLIEMFCEMRTVHHLLDLVGVPPGYSMDTRTIDCRVLLAVRGMMTLRERLARVATWHARETGPAGTVGDFCICCGDRWPCDTYRMATGVYVDEVLAAPRRTTGTIRIGRPTERFPGAAGHLTGSSPLERRAEYSKPKPVPRLGILSREPRPPGQFTLQIHRCQRGHRV